MIYVAVILVATLSPQPDWAGDSRNFFAVLVPSRPTEWKDAVLNVALYVPLGLLLAGRGRHRLIATLASFVLALAVELLQLAIPGRDAAAVDVIANAIGGALGAILSATQLGAWVFARLQGIERWLGAAVRADARRAAVLSVVWSAIVAAVIAMTSWLAAAAPPPPFYYIVSGPTLESAVGPLRIGGLGFRGRIDEVRMYSIALTGDDIRADMNAPIGPSRSWRRGLAAAYSFDVAEGAVARDETGQGHDGTVRDASWTREGRFGAALVFDSPASGVFVETTNALRFAQQMTIAAWVWRSRALSSNASVVADSRDAYYVRGSSEAGVGIPMAGGRFNAAPDFARLTRPIPVDRWTHMAVVYDGQTIMLYVNGQMAARRRHWSPHYPVQAMLNGSPLPFGLHPAPRQFRAAMLRDIAMSVRVRCGVPQQPLAPLFEIVGVGNVEVFSLAASGLDLWVRPPTRARALDVASPDYVVPGALRDCRPGEDVTFTITGPVVRPTIQRDGVRLEGTGPGIGSGWAFVVHAALIPSWLRTALTAITTAGFFIPFGLWMRPHALTIFGALLIAASVYVGIRVTHALSADAAVVAVAIAGVLGGLAISRSLDRGSG